MIANVFKPNLLCNKTTFFARAAHHTILPSSRRDVYNISSYIMKPVAVYQIFVNGVRRGGCDHLDHVEASLRDINQRSFYFLILPDSSAGLCFVRPTSPRWHCRPTGATSLQCWSNWICFSVHSGDESLSIWSGNEIFFTYITRVVGYMGISKKKPM